MKKLKFEKLDAKAFERLDSEKMKRIKGGYTFNTYTVYGNGSTNPNDGSGCSDGCCND
jgi:natural product precursor